MKYICAALCIFVISGCVGPVIKTFPSAGYENITKSSIGDVEIFKKEQQPSRSFYPVGSVYVEKWGNTTPTNIVESDVVPMVKDAASKMGADAVIGTHYTHYFDQPPSKYPFDGDFRMRAAGIAVKYGEFKKDVSEKHVEFLTLGFPEAGKRNAKILMKANNDVRLSIQYYLEKNGYFVNLSDATIDYGNVDDEGKLFGEMISASNDKYPVVMYAWVSSYKPDENEDRTKAKMNMVMYSKTKSKILYKNSIDVHGGSGNMVMLTILAGPIGLLGGMAADKMIFHDSQVLVNTAKEITRPLIKK